MIKSCKTLEEIQNRIDAQREEDGFVVTMIYLTDDEIAHIKTIDVSYGEKLERARSAVADLEGEEV